MLFKPRIGLITLAILLVLLFPAAHAAPNLRLQNQTVYSLNGSLAASQSCTAEPQQYASQACLGLVTLPRPMNTSVFIKDDGVCPLNSVNCGFAPSQVFVGTGTSVDWSNNGTLPHTVTSDLYSGQSFDSGNLSPHSQYRHIFSQPGTYPYHCGIHPWMKGAVTAILPPLPPPPPQTKVTVNFDGTVGWTVQGLDSDNALLQVDHSITVSVSPVPGVTVSPVSEHGSFSQNIDLATRIDSPGTASALLRGLFSSFLSGLPYNTYLPRTTATLLPGANVNDPFVSLQNSSLIVQPVSPVLPQQLLSQLPGFGTGSRVSYTMWWVNGPLSNGKTVKILTGTSAVTGDETLNLGDGIGSRNAWLVTSMLSQSLDISNPLSGSSTVSFSLNLAWSFDKKNDLLLRHATIASVDSKSITSQNVLLSNPCAPQGWCPTFAQVTVTRLNHIDLSLAFKLQSTNVKLNGNSGASSSDSSLASAFLQLPWSIMGPVIIGAGGGLTALIVWIVRRVRQHPVLPASLQNT